MVFNQLQSSTPLLVYDFTLSPCQYKGNTECDSIHYVCTGKRIQTNSYPQQKVYLLSEHFSNEYCKTKTKAITPANHKEHRQYNEPIKARITCSWRKARENECERVTIGFTSDWMKKWREFFMPIMWRSNVKPMSFLTQVKSIM